MKLATIGSGNIGKSIGNWAAKVGYEVIFSAKNPKKPEEAAKRAGNKAWAADVDTAIKEADLILLATPYSAAEEVVSTYKQALKGKILIDATNPLNEDFSSLKIGLSTSAGEEIAKRIPDTLVVKAFNTVFAHIYETQNPKINGNTISVFYAGDHAEAKSRVAELIRKMGFDAVDCGPLKSCRNLEPMAMMNIILGHALKYGTSIGFSLLR